MEQLLKSLLQKQGYDYIGIIDSDKKIWGYAKEGQFHFCLENLVEVDRNALGLTDKVLVITKEDDKLSFVEHGQRVRNYIIIDGSNAILKTENNRHHSMQLFRLDSRSVYLKKYDAYAYLWKNSDKSYITSNYFHDYLLKDQVVVVDEKVLDKYGLWDIIEDVYIFVSKDKILIHNGKDHTEIDSCSLIWRHVGGECNFLSVRDEDNRHLLYVNTLTSGHLFYDEIELFTRPQEVIGDLNHDIYHSNNYLIVPFLRSGYYGLRTCRDSVLIISYENHEIWSYPIYFKNNYKIVGFSNNIIIREYGYENEDDTYCVEYIDLYDVRGNELKLLCQPVHNNKYKGDYIFSKQNTGMFNNIDRLYGVVRLGSHYAKVVVPPIFESVEEIGKKQYGVRFGNYNNEKHHQFLGLYSIEEGLINAKAVRIEYHNNIEGKSLLTNTSDKISAFCKNEKVGLLYYGEKVIDACLDEICGFDFSDKWIGEKERTFDIDKLEKKTKEYIPKCVVLISNGKYGLFINKENIIMPQYDSLRCILISGENGTYDDRTDSFKYDKYAYFEAVKDGKVEVISDNPVFNKNNKDIYDKIEVDERFRYVAMIKVYKNEKVGLICSQVNRDGEPLLYIPIRYNDLHILSYISHHYKVLFMSDGLYYDKDGKQLLNANEYDYIKYSPDLHCWGFKKNSNDEYVFLNIFNGELLGTERNDDGNIVIGEGAIFDVTNEEFIIEESEDEDYDMDDYDYSDNVDYDRETYYALGGDDYDAFKRGGGTIDDMMDGLGF